jgi:DNA polymerase I
MTQPIFLIDGSGYIFRAFYAIRPLTTSKGIPTNAVYGFARMLLKLIREEKPHYLGIAFDPKDNFRKEIYTGYKSNREIPPEDLQPQFALIHELVEAMDIPVLLTKNYEADDVIATLTKQALSEGRKVVIVSGDKDLMQLVAPNVDLYDPMKDKHFGRDDVIEKFGVPPEYVVDVLALEGDSSDNIPGVPKVGAKSAAKLVQDFGDVEAIFAALQKQDKRKAYEQSVIDHIEDARLSKRLASLHADVPIKLDLHGLNYAPPTAEKLTPFLQKVEAFSLIKELNFTSYAATETRPIDKPNAVDRTGYKTVLTEEALIQIVKLAWNTKSVSIDLETTSLDSLQADIVGIGLCVTKQPAVYIPVGHSIGQQLPRDWVLNLLKPLLEDPNIHKLGQDLKFIANVLSRYKITLKGIHDDCMLAAYTLDPGRASYSLEALAREFLEHQNIDVGDIMADSKQFADISIEQASQYAAEDADVAQKLCDVLSQKIANTPGLEKLYRDLEIPLLPVLAKMEQHGVLINAEHLQFLSGEFTRRLADLQQLVEKQVGSPVNLGSPKQLSELLFSKLHFPVVKKTKTGFSTDQEVLEILARSFELPKLILDHRMLAKLKSTYVDALPRLIHPVSHRLHTSFNQTGTATGRLSSSDPNLQNIPIRSEDGKRIREAFIAPAGSKLISADYSQVELRLVAHLSKDERFITAFNSGADIHKQTAEEILTGGAPADSEMRRRAKAINFGILYGLSEFGLAKQLNISRSDAHDYIVRYFARYPGIRGLLDQSIEQGVNLGYVTTMLGRRRYLPELKSQNNNVRKGAERIAMNTPIQGSAAEIIKLAMLRVDDMLRKNKWRTRLLLQVHDELLFEAPNEECEEVIPLIRECMTDVVHLSVPLLVDIGSGATWAQAH